MLKHAPPRVSLRFDESVSTPFGAVRVLDENGRRVDDGRETRPAPDAVTVGLPPTLPRGTYVVTWRVVSADTHPVHGAFTFSVGAAAANANSLAAGVLSSEATPRSVSVGFGVVRFLRFLLLLLAGGAALQLAVSGLGRKVEVAAALTALAYVPVAFLGLVYQGALAGGFSILDAATWSVVHSVLETRFGTVWVLQAGLAVALAASLLLRRRLPAAVLGVLLVAACAFAAHAAADGTFAIVVDAAHVVAASAWTGGLAATALSLLVARDDRWQLAARIVPRFSVVATIGVAVLLAGGVGSAYLEVRAWRGLWETTYGQLVLAKAGLLLPLLALGLFNNRVSVPGIRVELVKVRRRFVRAAAVELVLVAVVLAVTAALVEEPPARAQVAQGGPFSSTSRLGPYELDTTVDPARTGVNEIHLYVLRPSGQPANATEANILASLPAARVGPLRFKASVAGPGHYVINGAQLPIAGRWAFRLEVRFGSFDQYETTLNIPISKGTS